MHLNKDFQLAVVGGGASGFMGAIKAAEEGVTSVILLEAAGKTLEKVRISGGGRCNVTHASWVPSDLIPNYPRGKLPLKAAFSRFATGDAVAWFEERGLELVIEKDGRIFPKSNSSGEVISCLHQSASRAGVICLKKKAVIDVEAIDKGRFILRCKDGSCFYSNKVLLATGDNPIGKSIASSLGHELVPSVPSIFSFKLSDQSLLNCAGISVDSVKLTLNFEDQLFEEEGRILITHKGISGPALLRLSAFAARSLFNIKYKALLRIAWVNNTNEYISDLLKQYRNDYPCQTLSRVHPFKFIPKRLWLHLLYKSDISNKLRWANFSSFKERKLVEILRSDALEIIGKGPFGEEFVTAGGVQLDEVNFKTMESNRCSGLYFAGEILDIDGVTGGFNFQHCWTSGWLAGKAIANKLEEKHLID
ncbi:NAD(P)/FAD-dependent oxidoreductase [Prochlorococcus sp. MIT 1223]|uniref:NAD(P)/FAD-dependent oxidoreductase n=1 Tax=Prochlorococcus sp. MIT 1223 TaxID=3096217 RepID=UPI002A759EF2|nr:NAD(P)/FAD-dependent oxidoreductase [Prochlorococcus sp. MIT 1223]